jgi:hypothetical protein
VAKLTYVFVQTVIGKYTMVLLRIIGFPDECGLVTFVGQMPVEAVFGDVEFTANEPFYTWFFEIPIEDLVPFFAPLKMTGDLTPKCFRVVDALIIGLPVCFFTF